MQITHCEVIPAPLKLKLPATAAGTQGGPPEHLTEITAIFVRLETRRGQSAWGCTVAHPLLTGCEPQAALSICRALAARAVDLHPLNIEFSLAELARTAQTAYSGEQVSEAAARSQAAHSPRRASPSGRMGEPSREMEAGCESENSVVNSALCAFDLAFHDLLGLAAGMPLYRLLGGYRNRIQTSITIPTGEVEAGVDAAQRRASEGFRILKIKGGLDPELDVRRVRAIHRALPELLLRLDADGGYSVQAALEVARALEGRLEMLEQPTSPEDLAALLEVTRHSPIPVLADQSACGPDSVLRIAAAHCAHGISVKLAVCGGLLPARRVDAIARAARLSTMVSCVVEPAMLIAAGLSLALSSPNVQYGDLDGSLHLDSDPSVPGFTLSDGWLTASDVPGLGYTVNLG